MFVCERGRKNNNKWRHEQERGPVSIKREDLLVEWKVIGWVLDGIVYWCSK